MASTRYTASAGRADRVLDTIVKRCVNLVDFPELGRRRDDIAEGARCLVFLRWLIIDRPIPIGILIVRVVDGRRDLSRLTWPTA